MSSFARDVARYLSENFVGVDIKRAHKLCDTPFGESVINQSMVAGSFPYYPGDRIAEAFDLDWLPEEEQGWDGCPGTEEEQ